MPSFPGFGRPNWKIHKNLEDKRATTNVENGLVFFFVSLRKELGGTSLRKWEKCGKSEQV